MHQCHFKARPGVLELWVESKAIQVTMVSVEVKLKAVRATNTDGHAEPDSFADMML